MAERTIERRPRSDDDSIDAARRERRVPTGSHAPDAIEIAPYGKRKRIRTSVEEDAQVRMRKRERTPSKIGAENPMLSRNRREFFHRGVGEICSIRTT